MLSWSADEVAAIERGERLRALGFDASAFDCVARGCDFPQWLQTPDYLAAVQLDLGRWYLVLTGLSWDGTRAAVATARAKARRHRLLDGVTALRRKGINHALYACCCSHLLVEPLDEAWNREGAAAYEAEFGWPTALDVGHLEWDDPNGFGCCFCEALLLRDEACVCPGAQQFFFGKYCCSHG